MASLTTSPGARAPLVMHQPEIIRRQTHSPADAIDSRKVMVAVPAYNREVTIGSIVLRARAHADHVIVIDNGSADNTTEVARLAGATVISARKNEENGKGIRDAFEFARRAGADVLVLIDGDALNYLEEIPQQIRPILEDKADFVNGLPPVKKGRSGDRKSHYPSRGRDVLMLATNLVRGRRVVSMQNGFRAFSRKMFDCFTFSQVSTVTDTEALDIAEANMKRDQLPRYSRSGPNRPAIDPFSGGTGGFNGPVGRLFRESPARLFCAIGAGMILFGAGCIFMLMNDFNATHNIGVEYGIGSMIFTFPGLLLFFDGMMLRSVFGIGKGKNDHDLQH